MIGAAHVANALAARGIEPDARQREAIDALVALVASIAPSGGNGGERASSLPARRRQGVYCHGLPGRGKSVVVDTVFDMAACRKRRLHFHEFLREMNRRLVSEPRGDDRLGSVSRQWLDGTQLLCFDEFHVHDIADAFLLGRFLDTAISLGTRIVLTSNYAPQGLLPDPEFHERFLPTIEQIERAFIVIHFDGARDYRFGGEHAQAQRFFAPLDASTEGALRQLFLRYEGDEALRPTTLSAAGRPLNARAAGAALLWANFEALCVASRSHLDYLDLAEQWHGLILDRVRAEWLTRAPVLQRLVWLVDILYDRKRALFIACDQPVETALADLAGAHDLSRTLSRLAEMRSSTYRHALDAANFATQQQKVRGA
ncbi:cell division protein ZapE [Paraburkholderia sp. PREW-6R]|uniref:cell division protein ZapE n=1 Tax=Paraburkholderia sp. PREW-6R TaxID=3141544 RepID=UPI0031F47D1B